MKLVVNLLLGINMEAIAEAVSLGEHLELNRSALLDVLPRSPIQVREALIDAHIATILIEEA